ncbi:MAG: DUF3575 domain-containing protein [Bacteroidia bacterium]
MLKRRLLFFCFLITFFTSQAGIKDTISYYLKNKYPELIGGLSGRNTFIGSQKTSITGVSVGALYGNKVRLTFGVYNLSKPLVERKTINAYTPSEHTVDETSNFWYFGLTGGYVFFKQKRWTLDVPVRIGFGAANIKQYDIGTNKRLIEENNFLIIPVESGIGVQYKIAWWIGLGAGLGSRIVVGKSRSQKFSGTYYNFGININFSEIYFHIRDDMKKNPVKKPIRK